MMGWRDVECHAVEVLLPNTAPPHSTTSHGVLFLICHSLRQIQLLSLVIY